MHPIRNIKQYKAARQLRKQKEAEQEAFDARLREFLVDFDQHVRVFGLDPNAPEIIELKKNAVKLMKGPMSDLMHMYLFWVNPYKDVTIELGGHLIIHERMVGHLLSPMTLVEFHHDKERFGRACHRIVVDAHGTRAYSGYDTLLVTYEAGILNPHRAADPGNRVRNAIAFVEHFTGLELTLEEMWPLYAAEFTLVDGEWTATYQTEPTTVS